MATLQIQANTFLAWRFSDSSDLKELGELQLKHLQDPKNNPPVTIDKIYINTGYIPKWFIISCSEKTNEEWHPSENDKVEWVYN